MSQSGQNSSTSGPQPPAVPTQFTTDVNGPAVPIANNLNVFGFTLQDNNDNGILTNGLTDNLYIALTNRVQGTVTTVGAITSPIITFTPTVIGTYSFEVRIAAYNTTASLGAAYSLFGSARFDGVNSNLIDIVDKIINEEGAMSSANSSFTVSGANILVNGIGYAAQTINWAVVGLYTFVGA